MPSITTIRIGSTKASSTIAWPCSLRIDSLRSTTASHRIRERLEEAAHGAAEDRQRDRDCGGDQPDEQRVLGHRLRAFVGKLDCAADLVRHWRRLSCAGATGGGIGRSWRGPPGGGGPRRGGGGPPVRRR